MAQGKGLGFFAGLVVGGLIGVAATIAFGPELDEKTRRRLREEALQWREKAGEMAAGARAQADVLVDLGREVIDEQRARLEEAIAEGKEAAAEKQRELRAKFEQAQGEGEAQL